MIFVGILSGKILAMTNNIILARFLQSYYFGIFLLGISVYNLISVACNLGIPGLLPKLLFDFKSDEGKNDQLISISITLCFISSFALSSIIILFAQKISVSIFHAPEMTNVLRPILFVLPFGILTYVIMSIFRGYKKTIPKVIITDLLPPGLNIAIFLLLFYLGLRLGAASYAFSISTITVFTVAFIIMLKTIRVKFRPIVYNSEITPNMFKLAWPLSIESFVWIIYTQIDRLSIGYFLTPVEVGIYGAAWAIAALLSFIPQSFNFLALPIFSNFISKQSISELRMNFNKISILIFEISLPLLFCIVLLSKESLTILYGKDYSSGALALSILALGIFSDSILGPASECLVSAGKTRAPLIATTVGCIINIVLNLLLIPACGIVGAAIATCTAMFIARFTLGYFNYVYLKIFPINYKYMCWFAFCISLTPLIYTINNNIKTGSILINALIAATVYLIIIYSILAFIIIKNTYNRKKSEILL